MIKLDRSKVKAPSVLVDKDGVGMTERQLAIEYFINKKKKEKPFEFNAYRSKEVKEALIQLSHKKCAYCETMEGGSDYDIEHFRPKGEISGRDQEKLEQGYYWLASDWNNLYLSCMHCNQKRMQKMVDGRAVYSGKKNQFPLSDENCRAKSWDSDIHLEEDARLLLDPGVDQPEIHLCFREVIEKDEEGNDKIMPVIDCIGIDGKKSAKGEKSLQVFGLNRSQLVNVRIRHYNQLMDRLKLIKEMIRQYKEDEGFLPPERIKARIVSILQLIKELADYCEDERNPFTAMARHFKKTHLGALPPPFAIPASPVSPHS